MAELSSQEIKLHNVKFEQSLKALTERRAEVLRAKEALSPEEKEVYQLFHDFYEKNPDKRSVTRLTHQEKTYDLDEKNPGFRGREGAPKWQDVKDVLKLNGSLRIMELTHTTLMEEGKAIGEKIWGCTS